MSYYSFCVTLMCILGTALAVDPISNCKDAPAIQIQLDKISGTWYEIARSDYSGNHEENAQCATTQITKLTNATGNYEFHFKKLEGKKFGKEQIVTATFTLSGKNLELEFAKDEPKVIIKLVWVADDFKTALLCATKTEKDNQYSGGWVLSTDKKLDAATQKLVDTESKKYKELSDAKEIEQDKKCSGASTIIPLLGLLLLTTSSTMNFF